MVRWEPTVTIVDAVTGKDLGNIDAEELGDWLDVVNGSYNKMVTLTVPPMPDGATTDREYRITFGNATGSSPVNQVTSAEIKVFQKLPYLNFYPATLPGVPTSGGATEWIEVKTGARSWQFDYVKQLDSESPHDLRRLVKHNAVIEVQNFDASGTPTGVPAEYEPGRNYPTTTKFRVKFPKIYYPNRDITPEVTLTVKVGGMERTINVAQVPLTAKPLSIYQSITDTHYGSFYGSAHNYISDGLNDYFIDAGFSLQNTGNINTWTEDVPENTTLLHSVYNNDVTWDKTNEYRALSKENWSMIQGQTSAGRDAMNNTSQSSPLAAAGHTGFAYGAAANAASSTYYANSGNTTKVMQYLLKKSPKNYLEGTTQPFWLDGISVYIPVTGIGSTGVPITIGANERCTAFIDISNRILWMGENEHWGNLQDNPSRFEGGIAEFGQNIADFMAKAVAYGSHFTDLLLEEGTDLGDGRVAQPAPWDKYWDESANEGTDNRLIPVRQTDIPENR
jgi:hypothetical protein